MRLPVLFLAALLTASPAWADWPHYTCLAASADGTLLAAGGRSGEVFLVEASTGELTARWTLPDGVLVTSVEPLAGNRAAASGVDGRFWLLEKDADPRPDSQPAEALRRRASAWLADRPLASGSSLTAGGWTFTGTPEGRLQARQAGQPPRVWPAAGASVTGLALLPGPKLVTAGYDGTLVLWDPASGKELGRL